MALAYDGFIPLYDNETGRQVFRCPFCQARLLGPDPSVKRPGWHIPLTCCATKVPGNPFSLDAASHESLSGVPRLVLQMHVWAHPDGRRTYMWKVADARSQIRL